jgi:hypothetical protein
LHEDWQAPPIDELPLPVQAIVRQWPKGAYELVALGFVNHWLSEGRAIGAKRDWPRTWSNWLVRESGQILRAAKAGVSFSASARTGSSNRSPAEVARDEAALSALGELQAREGNAEARIRRLVREKVGERTYDGWVKPSAMSLVGDEFTVTSPSAFLSSWLERNFREIIEAAAGDATGSDIRADFQVLRQPVQPP